MCFEQSDLNAGKITTYKALQFSVGKHFAVFTDRKAVHSYHAREDLARKAARKIWREKWNGKETVCVAENVKIGNAWKIIAYYENI